MKRIREADLLVPQYQQSVDPAPDKLVSVNQLLVKDLVSDHLRSLRQINRSLSNTQQLDAALQSLENEYYKIFGQRLTELSTAFTRNDKAAVLELRRQLCLIAKTPNPDFSYIAIDRLMSSIASNYNITPAKLHDAFVDILDTSPDDFAKQQVSK